MSLYSGRGWFGSVTFLGLEPRVTELPELQVFET
jgi:hypothetical protein